MKKYVIIILIFAIVSFSITGVLIYLKNNNVESSENIISLGNVITVIGVAYIFR